MAYEEDFSPYDMLDGYPAADAPVSTTVATPPPVQDFDPRRDISPMAGKLFDEIGSASHLKPQEKFAMQESLLRGINDVSAQRAKLENERRQSMMDNLRIQQQQESITALRQRQQSAIEQSAARSKFAETVQGVVTSNLDPVAKRTALDKLTADNLAFVGSDTAASGIIRNARDIVPLPKVGWMTDTQIMEKSASGVPPQVLATQDPVLIGAAEWQARTAEKARSTNEKDRKAAIKEKVSMIRDLAKDDFNFMDADERSEMKVSREDETPYLRPEDHERGRTLALVALGPQGFAEFDKLPDAEKREALRELRVKALTDALDEATAEPPSDEDIQADSLFGR